MFVGERVKEETESRSGVSKEPAELTDQVQVKLEPDFKHEETAHIKEEPCSDSVVSALAGVSADLERDDELTDLYANHEMKNELVLGPDCTHRPDVAHVACKPAPAHRQSTNSDTDNEDNRIRLKNNNQKINSDNNSYKLAEKQISGCDSNNEDNCITLTSVGIKGENKLKLECDENTGMDKITSGNDSESENTDDAYITEDGIPHTPSHREGNSKNNASDSEDDTKENNMINCERDIRSIIPRDCFVRLERSVEPFPNGKSKTQEHTIKGEVTQCNLTREQVENTTDAHSGTGDETDNDKEVCSICGERFGLKAELVEHAMRHIHMPMDMTPVTVTCDMETKDWAMASSDVWSSPSLGRAPRMRDCRVALERLQLPGADAAADHARGDSADSSHQPTRVRCEQVCDLCGETFALRSDLKKHAMIHIYSPAEMDEDDVWPHDQSQGSHVRTSLHEVNSAVQSDAEINTYVCDICGRTFEQKHNLIRHIQLHSFKISKMMSNSNRNHVSKERPYTCDMCGKKCIQKAHLVRHIQSHSDQKSYKCEICNKGFKHSTYLIIHKRTHTGERSYSCEICNKRFRYSNSLKYHKLVHSGDKPYSCDICKKSFTGSTGLRTHILTHFGVPFPCEICGKMFKRADSLKTHLLIHQGAKPYYCDICQKDFRQASNLRTHQRIHKAEKPYSCEICKMTFKHSSYLRSHKQTHTGERLHSCYICQSKFARADTLRTHMRVHTGEKPYSCEICNKKFKQQSHLEGHKTVHLTLRAFSCDICLKTYKSLEHLRSHKIMHSEDKLYYNCEICGKKFKRWSSYKSHKRIHSGVRPYSCEVCQKRFRRPEHLNVHKRIHTGDKPYACDMCNMRFTQSSSLRTHKRSVHMKPFSCEICDKQFNDLQGLEKHKRFHADSKMYSCEICTYRFSRPDHLMRHQQTHEEKSFFCKICKKGFVLLDGLKQHKRIHTGEKPYTCAMCNMAFRHWTTLKRHENAKKQCKKVINADI